MYFTISPIIDINNKVIIKTVISPDKYIKVWTIEKNSLKQADSKNILIKNNITLYNTAILKSFLFHINSPPIKLY